MSLRYIGTLIVAYLFLFIVLSGLYYEYLMKLGTKINLVLVAIVTVILTIAFWIVIDIEARNLKQQVINEAETVTKILLTEIEPVFFNISGQQQEIFLMVDTIGEMSGVVFASIIDVKNKKYIASTDHALNGQKIKEEDSLTVVETEKDRKVIDVKREEGGKYSIVRYIPIFLKANDPQSKIVNIIEIEVSLRSKESGDVRSAENLLDTAVASIKQGTPPRISLILPYSQSFIVIGNIVNSVKDVSSFHDLMVFNSQLEVIASTGNDFDDFTNDPAQYRRLREDVLSGVIPVGLVERMHGETPVIMRVEPIVSLDERTGLSKNIGLIETHVLEEVYASRVNELRLRMLGVGIVFTSILVIALAVFLRREIVGPITRYSKIAQKVSDGDLNQVIEHISDDEIGRFGDVFNSMVTNLREFDRLKSDFISVAAHQLRTPLSGVKWVLKLVLDGDLGAISLEQQEMLKRGFDTNEKMIQLVNDLLNVSRIENGKFGYSFENNDFGKLLRTLVENSDLVSKARNIEVLLEDRAQVKSFYFDAEKLLIALQNIVDNAIKYTLPGGRVTIITERQGDYVQIKIQDTGVGIPKDEIHKLFSKFFRATNVIHLQTDGSGLGLFIVKNIILRHGGQIWVDSVEGKGTTFTIIVPLIAELLPKEAIGAPAVPPAPAVAGQTV